MLMKRGLIMRAYERLLNYVVVRTPSDEHSTTSPSSQCQFDLARILADEMTALGISDVSLDEFCYVYGKIPATPGYENKPSIGFIAHMDTVSDYCDHDIIPVVHKNYDGGDLPFGTSGRTLTVKDFPHLPSLAGRTLITTDGTTVLGADDKAGVAEIMTMAETLLTHPEIPPGTIKIAFTPDEEVGSGADLFDLDYFKARFAYTVDGDYEGEVAYENFNAASASFEIKGVNVHPGEAKDIMINAALVGCEIASLLPENETPAHTEGREGFYHLTEFSGDIAHAKVNYIVRDHDKATFEKRLDTLRGIEKKMNEKYHADTVKLNIQHSYSNMLEVIEKNEYVVAIAKKAIKNVGLEPVSRPVRGGTDGARLSFMGLPCPNLGTGGYGFHGPFEHISVEGMDTAVSVIKEIVKITAE